MNWFRVERCGEKAFLHIRDEIGFGDGDVSDLLEQIGGAKDIELFVNSTGGCGSAAEQIFTAIKHRTSIATITGACASAAVRITHAARRVRIVPEGYMLIHSPRCWMFASIAEARETITDLEQLTLTHWNALCARVRDPDMVHGWLTDGKDHTFSADEAWHAGLVDEIYNPPAISDRAIELNEDGESVVLAQGNETTFFKVLSAVGPVTTSDSNRFLRELMAWGKMNVRQL
jgi:ATP-dependent protease ClpP protease subunit